MQEVLAQQQGLLMHGGEEAKDSDVLKGKLPLYEDLFYILQTRPQYFAKLARVLNAKDIPSFVQTVVFEMYGDQVSAVQCTAHVAAHECSTPACGGLSLQYDTREERLLLSLFRMVLQAELDAATDQGSLLRANTAITQML